MCRCVISLALTGQDTSSLGNLFIPGMGFLKLVWNQEMSPTSIGRSDWRMRRIMGDSYLEEHPLTDETLTITYEGNRLEYGNQMLEHLLESYSCF